MLHDIGIGACDAPDIHCFGKEHYIRHGITGCQMLRNYGAEHHMDLEAYARICEKHTGSGLTAAEIIQQKLPLPEQDFLPETPEEKLVCLADKFYSKSGNMQEKSLERIQKSMLKFGPAPCQRFQELCIMFQLLTKQ